MNKDIKIIGGGFAGLIAAHYFPNSTVFEAGECIQNHRAVLRFRSDVVSRITGIPFKQVDVDKAVYYDGQYYHDRCPINLANMYSMKVTGQYGSRSIMKLQSAKRYIAPPDFYSRMVDKLAAEHRIGFGHKIEHLPSFEEGIPVINTAPLPVMLKMAGIADQVDFSFKRSSIIAINIKLKSPSDVYQTIYFPDPLSAVYRASITGDVLIVEAIGENLLHYRNVDHFHNAIVDVCKVFGLNFSRDIDMGAAELVDQKYGKIVDIPKDLRHSLLFKLTMDLNVFSVGRFATWRNILLDDVAEDLVEVEKLINASSYKKFQYLMQK